MSPKEPCLLASGCVYTILRQQLSEDTWGVSGPTTPSPDKPGYGDTLARQVFSLLSCTNTGGNCEQTKYFCAVFV